MQHSARWLGRTWSGWVVSTLLLVAGFCGLGVQEDAQWGGLGELWLLSNQGWHTLSELVVLVATAVGAAGSALPLQVVMAWMVIKAAAYSVAVTLGLIESRPVVGWRWPANDIDLTTATDAEDLVVFMGDVVEFVGQDVALLADVCGEMLVGGSLAGTGLLALRRLLSMRQLKR